jgi:hypothetical protein
MIKPGETFYRVVETPTPAAIDGDSDSGNGNSAAFPPALSETPSP